MIAILALLLHGLLMLAAAPTLAGLVEGGATTLRRRSTLRVSAALAAARDGCRDVWAELRRVWRKDTVVADTAGPLAASAPALAAALTLAAAALTPSAMLGMALARWADPMVIGALLAASRGILVLAAMDAASGESALGASRSAALGTLSLPLPLLTGLAVSLLAQTGNLDAALAALRDVPPRLPQILVALCLLVAACADTAPRVGPGETGVLHQAVALSATGRHLVLLRLEAFLRTLVWLDLAGALVWPALLAPPDSPRYWLLALPAWVIRSVVLAVGVGVVTRVYRTPRDLTRMLAAAVFAMVLALLLLCAGEAVA